MRTSVRLAPDTRRGTPAPVHDGHMTRSEAPPKLPRKVYEAELFRLQGELVKLQEWIRETGQRLVVIFEGRDAAGKGGAQDRLLFVSGVLPSRRLIASTVPPDDLRQVVIHAQASSAASALSPSITGTSDNLPRSSISEISTWSF